MKGERRLKAKTETDDKRGSKGRGKETKEPTKWKGKAKRQYCSFMGHMQLREKKNKKSKKIGQCETTKG